MVNDRRINTGDFSRSAIGDGNLFNDGIVIKDSEVNMFVDGGKVVQESEIHNICNILASTPLKRPTKLDVSKNADWLKKICFNDLKKYKEKFEIYMPYYDNVENVITASDIDGETVLRNIKSIYIDIKYSEESYTSDRIIDLVYTELEGIVRASVQQLTIKYERLRDALHLIIFYAFTFCQLLEVPPENYGFSI